MDHDTDGSKCPFGSHLRRTNPRDNFEDNGVKESLRLTRRHRIMRRARLYGDPYVGSPLNHSPDGEVGWCSPVLMQIYRGSLNLFNTPGQIIQNLNSCTMIPILFVA